VGEGRICFLVEDLEQAARIAYWAARIASIFA
jgi:hypothetical protein